MCNCISINYSESYAMIFYLTCNIIYLKSSSKFRTFKFDKFTFLSIKDTSSILNISLINGYHRNEQVCKND